MSYDLVLVRGQGHESLEAIAKTRLDDEADDPNPGPIDPAAEVRKQEIADELLRVNPSLERFRFDFREIAQHQGTNEEEARRGWRHVELDGERIGVQMMLHDDHATVTLAYWHRGDAARAAWSEIWNCLRVLERVGGLRAFDPQLERALALDRDLDAVLAKYAEGVAVTQRPRST